MRTSAQRRLRSVVLTVRAGSLALPTRHTVRQCLVEVPRFYGCRDEETLLLSGLEESMGIQIMRHELEEVNSKIM